jgi:hypothetical protein
MIDLFVLAYAAFIGGLAVGSVRRRGRASPDDDEYEDG